MTHPLVKTGRQHAHSLQSCFGPTHHTPQPEKPIAWTRANTHWRKKTKKKAMKLNELSALWTWKKENTKRWYIRKTNKPRVALFLLQCCFFLLVVNMWIQYLFHHTVQTMKVQRKSSRYNIANNLLYSRNTFQHYKTIIPCDTFE